VANLQIKDLPEDVHAELRRRARLEGVTVRSYVLGLIMKDQQLPSSAEWFMHIRSRRPVALDRPIAEWVADDRHLRDERTIGGHTGEARRPGGEGAAGESAAG
jgi:hypothetical protein